MDVLIFLIPAALFLGGLGLAAFYWAVKSDQFDDPDGDARRILDDRFDDRPDTPSADAIQARSRPDDRPPS